jgi:hypothetical protein
MPTFYVIGSSHAVRLFRIFNKKHKFRNKYVLKNLSKSGANYETIGLQLPPPGTLKKDDVVFFQGFGNDIMKKNIHVETTGNRRIFHLTKFEPYSMTNIQQKFDHFKDYCLSIPCEQIVILDLITRHINCCSIHRFNGLLKHQKAVNKTFRETFSNIPKINLVRFLKNLGYPVNWLNKTRNLQKLYTDTVHLKDHYYEKIAQEVERILNL